MTNCVDSVTTLIYSSVLNENMFHSKAKSTKSNITHLTTYTQTHIRKYGFFPLRSTDSQPAHNNIQYVCKRYTENCSEDRTECSQRKQVGTNHRNSWQPYVSIASVGDAGRVAGQSGTRTLLLRPGHKIMCDIYMVSIAVKVLTVQRRMM